jgi:hypothetical protein
LISLGRRLLFLLYFLPQVYWRNSEMRKFNDPDNMSFSVGPDLSKIEAPDFDKINFGVVDKCKHKEKDILRERLCLYLDDGKSFGLFIAIICLNCGKTEIVSQEIIKNHPKKNN